MSDDLKDTIAARSEAERAVLGCLLQDAGRVMPLCNDAGVGVQSFHHDANGRVFGAFLALQEDGRPIDFLTVSEQLRDSGDLDAVGGEESLGGMITAAPTTAHAEYYIRLLCDAELVRKIQRQAQAVLDACGRGGVSPDDLLSNTERGFYDLRADRVEALGRKSRRIVSAGEFLAEDREKPPEVIHGVLRAAQVGMLAASSKAGKSWGMLSLGLAVAAGHKWLGWSTTKGRALYINAELPPWDLESRLKKLRDSLGLDSEADDGLDVWHLRGATLSIRELIPDVLRRQEAVGAPYGVIIPDPLYCFGGGRDENDNSEQAITMGELGALAERSGAGVMVAHHFAKGNKSQTDHLDRASGAGMFARAVDTFMTLTRHEAEDAYTVETTTRSFAKPDAFVVRWDYPLWSREENLDPSHLKQATKPGGRKAAFTAEDAARLLPADGSGLGYNAWMRLALDFGMSEWQFKKSCQLEAVRSGLAVKNAGIYSRGTVKD